MDYYEKQQLKRKRERRRWFNAVVLWYAVLAIVFFCLGLIDLFMLGTVWVFGVAGIMMAIAYTHWYLTASDKTSFWEWFQ